MAANHFKNSGDNGTSESTKSEVEKYVDVTEEIIEQQVVQEEELDRFGVKEEYMGGIFDVGCHTAHGAIKSHCHVAKLV